MVKQPELWGALQATYSADTVQTNILGHFLQSQKEQWQNAGHAAGGVVSVDITRRIPVNLPARIMTHPTVGGRVLQQIPGVETAFEVRMADERLCHLKGIRSELHEKIPDLWVPMHTFGHEEALEALHSVLTYTRFVA
jgi:hypothetical protein